MNFDKRRSHGVGPFIKKLGKRVWNFSFSIEKHWLRYDLYHSNNLAGCTSDFCRIRRRIYILRFETRTWPTDEFGASLAYNLLVYIARFSNQENISWILYFQSGERFENLQWRHGIRLGKYIYKQAFPHVT